MTTRSSKFVIRKIPRICTTTDDIGSIQRYDQMITIIGTGHVFDISDELEMILEAREPDVIAVELDRKRYEAMISEEEDSKDLPLMYRALSLMQKKIAGKYGVKVGSEMLTAIQTAEQIDSDLAFIDLPANIMFKKMMSAMSFKEKLYMVGGMIAGLFTSKKRIDKEVERFQKNEEDYLDILEKEMPSISRVLIEERNQHMARNILELQRRFKTVTAVVGDGHVPGLLEEIRGSGVSKEDIEIIRLKDLRKGDFDRERKDGRKNDEKFEGNRQVSYSFSYESS